MKSIILIGLLFQVSGSNVMVPVCKSITSRACASCKGETLTQCISGADFSGCTSSSNTCGNGGTCAQASGNGPCSKGGSGQQ